MDRHLHIVSFNIPYPPDYGGVIDVYYKIRALHRKGVKVHLHCFQYGREVSEKLLDICASVNYYPRKRFYQAIYSKVPYIVQSRKSGELLSNLVEDEHPILFEGLHTCFYLSHPDLKGRVKAVRMHNIEWDYYRGLGKAERNFFRRFYFLSEAKKLREFEPELSKATTVMAISPNDNENLSKELSNVAYVPAFHHCEEFTSKLGKGQYALYHGNLSVVENNQAAMYLLNKVFGGLPQTLVIAGRRPLATLKKTVGEYANVELIADPSDEQMQDLIENAHLHVLPTFQATGIKLKLLHALYSGRFVVANSRMVQNTGLERLCIVENDSGRLRELVKRLFEMDFEQEDIDARREVLEREFSNSRGAEKIIELVFPPSP